MKISDRLRSGAAFPTVRDITSTEAMFTPRATRTARRADRKRYKGGGNGAPQYSMQDNNTARQLILQYARPMIQPTMAQSITGNNVAQGQTVTFNLNNVGLQTKVTVEVSGTLTQAAAETLRKTPWGLANIFSQVVLTDLSNYQRVNTTGLHLFALQTIRNRGAAGAAFVNDSPIDMGSSWQVNDGPNAVQGAATFRMFLEIPLAYAEASDLRGAIYSNVTNAQWRLQLTVNPAFIAPSTATDTLFACYKSTTPDVGILSNFKIQVYQHYLDQLPRGKNGQPVVPLYDIAWNYLLINTVSTGMVASQDFPVQYANFRTFLSTIAIYDNGGTLNAGSDVNFVGIQVANQTFLEKLDPYMCAYKNRNMIGDDFPPGTYVMDHRRWPIVTDQFGNTQFVLNANAVNASASLQMMYEMLSVQNQAINAGSLSAG